MIGKENLLNTTLSDIGQIASGLPRSTIEVVVKRHEQTYQAKSNRLQFDGPVPKPDVPVLERRHDELARRIQTTAQKHGIDLSALQANSHLR